jgi:hypothetical protein
LFYLFSFPLHLSALFLKSALAITSKKRQTLLSAKPDFPRIRQSKPAELLYTETTPQAYQPHLHIYIERYPHSLAFRGVSLSILSAFFMYLILYEACLTFRVLRETSEKFGRHAGNMEVSAQN